MKTIVTIYARHLLDSYNLGDPVVFNCSGTTVYGWVISDAIYVLLLLTHQQDSSVFNHTQEALYLWGNGSISYNLKEDHNKVIELWSKR